MAKGSRGGKSGRYPGGGLGAGDILSTTDFISERGAYTETVDGVLTVARDVGDEYGLLVDYEMAEIKASAGAIAYYGGGTIGWNKAYADSKKLNDSYDDCVKSGFHPGRGNRTAAEAVAAHEYGHALTDKAVAKLGARNLEDAANMIVKEARKQTKHKGVVIMSRKISTYATSSNAEAIAEAFSDVYCNGKKAKSESRAIVSVLNKYAK